MTPLRITGRAGRNTLTWVAALALVLMLSSYAGPGSPGTTSSPALAAEEAPRSAPAAFRLQSSPSSARAAFIPPGAIGLDQAFDPISNTVLPGGTYNFDTVNIRAGVTVSITGAVVFSVTGDVQVAGILTGDCFGIRLEAAGNIAITGVVDNRCSGATDPGDLTIYSYGGNIAIGTITTPAEVQTSGNLDVSNDPSLQEWEFDVLPHQRSATPLAPVCAAAADTLIDAVAPISGTEIAFFGDGADPDGGPVTYLWDLGDGGSSTEQSPRHTYFSWGIYDVALTVSDDDGQSCQATLRLVLDDGEANFPEAPAAAVAPGSLVVAAGTEALFYSAGADPQGGALTYEWDLGDTTTSTETHPVHAYSIPGRYAVTLTVTDENNFTSTATASVYVFRQFNVFLPYVAADTSSFRPASSTPTQIACLVGGPNVFNPVSLGGTAGVGRDGKDMRWRGRGDVILGPGTTLEAQNGGNGRASAGAGVRIGGRGGQGGNLEIDVQGTLTICGGASFKSGNGGNGGTANSNTPAPGRAYARGGNGGAAANKLEIRATRGLDFVSPLGTPIVVNPGIGGNGGAATAVGGPGGVAGCIGQPGASAEAYGGDGGKASKTAIVAGAPTGLANVEIQGGQGGAGGTAGATGGAGGSPTCPGSATGGLGQPARARGGTGGEAHLTGMFGAFALDPAAFTAGAGGDTTADGGAGGDATATPPGACSPADATGGLAGLANAQGSKGGAGRIHGDGGDATAAGGQGGDATATGGDCTNCGKGGDATANSGRGGDATARFGVRGGAGASDGTADATGGAGGTATATGGRGGDCLICPAGKGGDGGIATATSGAGGNATGNGTNTGGASGNANATGGLGGTGATCCDPPLQGGNGGNGGSATSTVGTPGTPGGAWGSNGIKGGDGGNGGDGDPPGVKGPKGIGTGTPVDIPDGIPGVDGGPCPLSILDPDLRDIPDPAFAGGVITYTIRITNIGSLTATGVVVTETYPSEVTFLGANPPPSVGDNIWQLADIAPGFFVDIFVYVRVGLTVPSGTVILNQVTVDSLETNPVSVTEGTLIQQSGGPVLVAEKYDSPDPVPSGGILLYTIAVTNTGTAPATTIVVTETYPAGIHFLGANPMPIMGDHTWIFPSLAPGEHTIIVIQSLVEAPSGTLLTNTVTVDSAETDPIVVQEQTLVQGKYAPAKVARVMKPM